jgi:hypothetical protein
VSNYDSREYKFYAPKHIAEAVKAEARALEITEIALIKMAIVNQLKAQREMWDERGDGGTPGGVDAGAELHLDVGDAVAG